MTWRGRQRIGPRCPRWLLPVVAAALGGGPVQAASPAAPPAPPGFEIRDWMAVGSGCRARRSQPGDAQVRWRPDGRAGGRYRVQIELPGYRLEGDRPAAPGALDFARECAIRLAIHPGAGKRVTVLAADARFSVERGAGARVRLRSRLLVGNETLSRREAWIAASGPGTHDLSIRPEDRAGAAGARGACAEPRLVGLDLSAALFRDTPRPTATVQLEQHLASLTLEIEDCVPPATPGARTP